MGGFFHDVSNGLETKVTDIVLRHFFIPTFRLKQILTAKARGGKDLLRKALPKFVNQN